MMIVYYHVSRVTAIVCVCVCVCAVHAEDLTADVDGRLADVGDGGAVVVVRAVREVESGDVETGGHHQLERRDVAARRADGGDDRRHAVERRRRVHVEHAERLQARRRVRGRHLLLAHRDRRRRHGQAAAARPRRDAAHRRRLQRVLQHGADWRRSLGGRRVSRKSLEHTQPSCRTRHQQQHHGQQGSGQASHTHAEI